MCFYSYQKLSLTGQHSFDSLFKIIMDHRVSTLKRQIEMHLSLTEQEQSS